MSHEVRRSLAPPPPFGTFVQLNVSLDGRLPSLSDTAGDKGTGAFQQIFHFFQIGLGRLGFPGAAGGCDERLPTIRTKRNRTKEGRLGQTPEIGNRRIKGNSY